MKLSELCESVYFKLQPRIRDEKTRHQYRIALRDFAEFLGRPPTLDDLSDDSICGLMVHLLGRHLAPKTVNERRGRINAMWTWLAKRNYVKSWPTTPPIPEPERIPVGWSREQLAALVAAVEHEQTSIDGVPGPLWWRSLHLTLWDSMERISAVIACRWEHLDGEWLVIPAELRKGKRHDMAHKLRTDTLAAIESIRQPERRLIWPWPYHPSYLWIRYKEIRRRAGLPTDRYSSFHRMRKSAASHFEAAGGDATAALGHENRRTTMRYLDPTIINKPRPSDVLFRIDEPIDKSPPPGKETW